MQRRAGLHPHDSVVRQRPPAIDGQFLSADVCQNLALRAIGQRQAVVPDNAIPLDGVIDVGERQAADALFDESATPAAGGCERHRPPAVQRRIGVEEQETIISGPPRLIECCPGW